LDIILIQLTCNVSHALQAWPHQEQQKTHTLDLLPIVMNAMWLLLLLVVVLLEYWMLSLWFAPHVLKITNGIQETVFVSIAQQEQIQDQD